MDQLSLAKASPSKISRCKGMMRYDRVTELDLPLLTEIWNGWACSIFKEPTRLQATGVYNIKLLTVVIKFVVQ